LARSGREVAGLPAGDIPSPDRLEAGDAGSSAWRDMHGRRVTGGAWETLADWPDRRNSELRRLEKAASIKLQQSPRLSQHDCVGSLDCLLEDGTKPAAERLGHKTGRLDLIAAAGAQSTAATVPGKSASNLVVLHEVVWLDDAIGLPPRPGSRAEAGASKTSEHRLRASGAAEAVETTKLDMIEQDDLSRMQLHGRGG
jgi:hypothetical protein